MMRHHVSRSRSTYAWLLAFALGAMPGLAAAQSASAPVATDSRVKTFVFNENDVYNLLTYYGFQSNVEFGPKETIETVSIGDRAGWQVVPAGRRLFIRAVANELHTNMTVITNLRAYQFDLRATDPATVPQEELVYVIRFFYPDDAANARVGTPLVPAAPSPMAYPTPAPQPTAYAPPQAPVSAAPLAPLAPSAPSAPAVAPLPAPITSYGLDSPPAAIATGTGTAPRSLGTIGAAPAASAPAQPVSNRYGAGPFDTPLPAGNQQLAASHAAAPAPAPTPAPPPASVKDASALNFSYTYTGDNALLPYALFDDGKRTYFQFAPNAATPRVSSLDKNGKATRLKLKKEGDYMVASTTAARFSLLRDNKTATIYNETRQ